MNQTITNELIAGLQQIFTNHLISIILYGSVARGTDSNESDIDIAILIDGIGDETAKDKLLDFAVDMDLKYDKVFSIVDINYNEFIKWENTLPYYKNMVKDGVVLWKVA